MDKRWPIIKNRRCYLRNVMDIYLAICILHNIALLWKIPELHGPLERKDNQILIMEEDEERPEVRATANIIRDRLLANMPPPTASERRRLRELRETSKFILLIVLRA